MKFALSNPLLALLLLCAALLPAASAPAGQDPTEGESKRTVLPLREWFAAGEIEQIPWDIESRQPHLRLDQQVAIDFWIRIRKEYLASNDGEHDFFLFFRVVDNNGALLNGGEKPFRLTRTPQSARLLGGLDSHFSTLVSALVRPGEYRAAVLLYDRLTDLRSVRFLAFKVKPLKKDPIPDSFCALPFFQTLPTNLWQDAYHPEVDAKLCLPLDTSTPLEIEILVLLESGGSPRDAPSGLGGVLGLLKALSEIQPLNGRLNVRALDIDTGKIVFSQENLGDLDWPRLRESVAHLTDGMVSVEQLRGLWTRAAVLRKQITELLRPGADSLDGNDPTAADPFPHRVLIVLSGGLRFPRGSDREPVQPIPCDCRVYYFSWFDYWDELGKILKPLKARQFEIHSPRDLRKALGKILAELRQL